MTNVGGRGVRTSSSSSNRGNFIKLIQNKVIKGENRAYNNTSDFINRLNSEVGGAYRKLENDLMNLISKYGYSSEDKGYQYRKGWNEELTNKLLHFKLEMNEIVCEEAMSHFVESYYNNMDNKSKIFGMSTSFTQIDKEGVIQAINYPWSGAMWSDRVWKNRNQLNNELKGIIVQGLLSGESNKNMAKLINRTLIQDGQKHRYVTERLIRTEVARVRYVADRKCYSEIGVKNVEFLSFIDSRTSNFCKEHDGKVFELGKEPPLPAHPHCRSCYVPADVPRSLNAMRNDIRAEEEREFNELSRVAEAKNYANISDKRSNINVTLNRIRNEIQEAKVGVSAGDRAKLNKFRREIESYADKVMDKRSTPIFITMGKKKIKIGGKEILFDFPICDFVYPQKGGLYHFNASDDVDDKEKNFYKSVLEDIIAKDNRFLGVKIYFGDNEKFKRSSTMMGYNNFGYDYIAVRGVNWVMDYFKISEKEALAYNKSTIYHELFHRVHNNYLEGLPNTLTKKEWEGWKKDIDKYYNKHRNKPIRELHRMTYPVNAEDYYKDGGKEHYYQEMWAEINSIYWNEDSKEDWKLLNKYFEGIDNIMKKYEKTGVNK